MKFKTEQGNAAYLAMLEKSEEYIADLAKDAEQITEKENRLYAKIAIATFGQDSLAKAISVGTEIDIQFITLSGTIAAMANQY